MGVVSLRGCITHMLQFYIDFVSTMTVVTNAKSCPIKCVRCQQTVAYMEQEAAYEAWLKRWPETLKRFPGFKAIWRRRKPQDLQEHSTI